MLIVISIFLCTFCLFYLLDSRFNRKLLELTKSLSVSSEIEISLANELKRQAFQIARITYLLDLLQNGICNPVVQDVYLNIRNLPDEEFPKNIKDLAKVLQKISDEQHIKTCNFLKERIIKAGSDDEKVFFESKLSKIQEIRNLSDSIGEDSSKEFVQIVINDLMKSMSEFNENNLD